MISETTHVQMSNLPDPAYQPEFYAYTAVKRLGAWVVDTLITALLTVMILPFTGFLALFALVPLYFVVGFAYRTVTLANRSATWGMRLMVLELRRRDGGRFDLEAAALHTLGYSISVAVPLLQVVSIVLMLTSPRGQGLTDRMLGTAAMNRPAR